MQQNFIIRHCHDGAMGNFFARRFFRPAPDRGGISQRPAEMVDGAVEGYRRAR
jgi:hypothetical protein